MRLAPSPLQPARRSRSPGYSTAASTICRARGAQGGGATAPRQGAAGADDVVDRGLGVADHRARRAGADGRSRSTIGSGLRIQASAAGSTRCVRCGGAGARPVALVPRTSRSPSRPQTWLANLGFLGLHRARSDRRSSAGTSPSPPTRSASGCPASPRSSPRSAAATSSCSRSARSPASPPTRSHGRSISTMLSPRGSWAATQRAAPVSSPGGRATRCPGSAWSRPSPAGGSRCAASTGSPTTR